MPDIVKLPELAKLFDIAIDQLLGEYSRVIEVAANGDLNECFKDGTINIDDICDVSCMLKPDQIAVIAKSERATDIPGYEKLLPFLSSGVVNDIARKMINEGENITKIAPFVSKDTIGEIAEVLYEKHGINALNDMAPFMQKEQIIRLVERDYTISGQYCWELIAPFIDRKDLNDFIQKLISDSVYSHQFAVGEADRKSS